jgi:hypothetical protein
MACSSISTLPSSLFSNSCVVTNTSQNVPVILALKECCTATTFSDVQETSDHCYYYCNITSILEITPMHDCLTGFLDLDEKGIDVASFDMRFFWKPESTGNAESGKRIDLRAIDPFIIEPGEAEPGSLAGEGPEGEGSEGGGGAQRGQGSGEGEGCTSYTLTELGAVCAGGEGGQGGNGQPGVLTSNFTATVSTTGAGSRSSGGASTPQASPFVSNGQRENVEWAVGLLVVLASLGCFL